jgi:hypothetical protein
MKTHFALAFASLALAPVPALAETQDEQNACMNDAFSVCGHAIPDRDRAGGLPRPEQCRAVMQRYAKPNQPTVVGRANQPAAGARTKLSTRD